MKLTKSQLKQIIKEELEDILINQPSNNRAIIEEEYDRITEQYFEREGLYTDPSDPRDYTAWTEKGVTLQPGGADMATDPLAGARGTSGGLGAGLGAGGGGEAALADMPWEEIEGGDIEYDTEDPEVKQILGTPGEEESPVSSGPAPVDIFKTSGPSQEGDIEGAPGKKREIVPTDADKEQFSTTPVAVHAQLSNFADVDLTTDEGQQWLVDKYNDGEYTIAEVRAIMEVGDLLKWYTGMDRETYKHLAQAHGAPSATPPAGP